MATPSLIWANYSPNAAPRYTLADGVNVSVGTLVYVDASGTLSLADADAVASYAMFISMETRRENDDPNAATICVCTEALVEDTDAPYTTLQKQYLSSTAGAFTGTRPAATSTSRVVQVVGWAECTSRVHLKIDAIKEQHMYVGFGTLSSLNEAAVVIDSGNFASINYNADNDIGYITVRVPDNAVSLADAFLCYAEEAEVAAITLAITVGSALHDAQHDAVTQDATITAFDVAGTIDADDIGISSISTAFDATDIIRPGALLGVKVNVDLVGTDTTALFGIDFVWNVV